MRHIIVVPHDPAWAGMFEAEAALLRPVFADNLLALHHIGSTSIPGIRAKPIIDMLPVVKDIAAVDALNAQMEALGYEAMGEFGISGRRYFRKSTDGVRSHHVHTFQQGNSDIARHLNFAAYLRAHPEDAERYSRLKIELAKQFPHDIEGYCDGKDALIAELDAKALKWAQGQG